MADHDFIKHHAKMHDYLLAIIPAERDLQVNNNQRKSAMSPSVPVNPPSRDRTTSKSHAKGKKRSAGKPASSTRAHDTIAAVRQAMLAPNAQKISLADDAEVNLRELRERLGISQQTLARLIGVSTRSIADWESGKQTTASAQRKIVEFHRLQTALAEVMNESFIVPWIETPNPGFEGFKPLEIIERGEVDRIWLMIYYLGSGMPT